MCSSFDDVPTLTQAVTNLKEGISGGTEWDQYDQFSVFLGQGYVRTSTAYQGQKLFL